MTPAPEAAASPGVQGLEPLPALFFACELPRNETGRPKAARIDRITRISGQLDDVTDERHAAGHVARAALVLGVAAELDVLVVAADVDDRIAAEALRVLRERDHRGEECPLTAFLV